MFADQIGQYVIDHIVIPARNKNQLQIKFTAGQVHKALDLTIQMQSVCRAIDTKKFQNLAGVKLIERSGPEQGKKSRWIFEVDQ